MLTAAKEEMLALSMRRQGEIARETARLREQLAELNRTARFLQAEPSAHDKSVFRLRFEACRWRGPAEGRFGRSCTTP